MSKPIDAVFRPISNWPGPMTKRRKRSPFSASWSSTLELLRSEIGKIAKRGEKPVIEMALQESQIRLDGYPYADARPEHPGVIVNIESKWGPLRYPCDTFTDWRDNVRAIALALESLRRVNRYGVTKHGEQYAGWKALPPSGESTETMTATAAADVLARTASLNGEWAVRVLKSRDDFREAYRRAVKYAHPDAGGTLEGFQRLQTAHGVLERHHGVS